MTLEIKIPLVNPNETEAFLASLYVREGDWVEKDALICTLETTKSTADVYADSAGYFVGQRFKVGDTVIAGDILGYLAESVDWKPPDQGYIGEDQQASRKSNSELRITKPALVLAESFNLDLSKLSPGVLITEKVVREFLREISEAEPVQEDHEFNPRAILIYGGGGHGKSILELIESSNVFDVVGFIDDGVPKGEIVMGVQILGNKELLPKLHTQGVRQAVNAVGGIGNVRVRQVVFGRLIQAGFSFPTLVHPTACVEKSAKLSPGVQVFPLAYIGSEVEVGFGAIVNTGAIVSHECVLGDLVNISPGAVLAGGVEVGEGALIGMGATINLQVRVGAGARVGNGATVKSDVPEGGVVSAGTIWPK